MINPEAIVVGAFDTAGDFITIAAAREVLAQDGRPISRDTASSIFLEGRVAPDGNRYRPACAKLGKRWVTTRQALDEFLARIAGVEVVDDAPQPKRTRHQRNARSGLALSHGVLVGAGKGHPRLCPGTDDSLHTRTSAPDTPSHRATPTGGRGVYESEGDGHG